MGQGFWRVFWIFFGNLWDLAKLNMLFCLCALPFAASFLTGFFGIYTGFMYILAIIAAFPIGGALAAHVFCVTKMLREEPGYVWHDFKRKFLENVKQAAAPGIFCVVFVCVQIFMPVTAAGVIFLLLFLLAVPYVFLQIAYIDLPISKIIKNGVMLSLMNAPKSLIGVLLGGLIWIAFVLYLPLSLIAIPFFLFIGFSFSWLLCLCWVWPPVNKQFKIEEAIQKSLD